MINHDFDVSEMFRSILTVMVGFWWCLNLLILPYTVKPYPENLYLAERGR